MNTHDETSQNSFEGVYSAFLREITAKSPNFLRSSFQRSQYAAFTFLAGIHEDSRKNDVFVSAFGEVSCQDVLCARA